MNSKRTMSEALQAGSLSADAAAFVAAGAAGNSGTTAPAASALKYPRATILPPTLPADAGNPSGAPFIHSPLPLERRAPVSMTFRLPAELPSALLRAAMERKLRGEQPGTQQDIVAQAVREWLERNAPRG